MNYLGPLMLLVQADHLCNIIQISSRTIRNPRSTQKYSVGHSSLAFLRHSDGKFLAFCDTSYHAYVQKQYIVCVGRLVKYCIFGAKAALCLCISFCSYSCLSVQVPAAQQRAMEHHPAPPVCQEQAPDMAPQV